METIEFDLPENPAARYLKGCGRLNGGFNIASIAPGNSDWDIEWCRTGGTGNHGVAALVPRSDAARGIATAISNAYFSGLVDSFSARSWKEVCEAGIVQNIYPPVGATESRLFTLYAYREHTGEIRVKTEWVDNITKGSVCAYFRMVVDYPTAGSLPGIYDKPAYVLQYLGEGCADSLLLLEQLGILVTEQD